MLSCVQACNSVKLTFVDPNPNRGNKIFYIYIFSCKAVGAALSSATPRNALRIRRKVGNESVQMETKREPKKSF